MQTCLRDMGLEPSCKCADVIEDRLEAVFGWASRTLEPLFTTEEGAAGHCEGGAQVLFHSKVFDWLDKTLMEATPRAAVA